MASGEDPIDRLRRELAAIGGRVTGDAAELEYHLTRLSASLESHVHLAVRTRFRRT